MKTIYISGIIGMDVTADSIREQIDSKSTEKLRVIINSGGGSVSEGFEIYNILKAYKGSVEIVLGVMAASIASYIAMAAPVQNRKAFKNSTMMIHETRSGIYGRSRDFSIMKDVLEGYNNLLADVYSIELKIEKEDALNKISEDFYMIGWESLLENNVISDIIDIEEVDIPQKEEDEDIFMFFAELEKSLESCMNEKVLKAKMYECENKAIEIENKNFDISKAVAYLKDFSPAEKPVENKSNQEDANMDFKEYLESNPEAQTELDKRLNSAREEGKKEAEATLQVEKEKIAEILNLENVKLSEAAVTALAGDMTVDQYTKEALIAEREKRIEKKNPFTQLMASADHQEQVIDVIDEKKSLKDFDKETEAMAAQFISGGTA